jgi:probable lipoprotein NlpC
MVKYSKLFQNFTRERDAVDAVVRLFFAGCVFFAGGPALFGAPPLEGRAILTGRAESADNAVEARNRLLSAADTYQGTPYRYGGMDRNGLDCSGFIYASFKDSLGVSVPRTTSALYNWTEKISEKSLQPGDLVFFITTGPGISHAGIYAGERRFIHSASDGPKTGVMYSSLDESYWRKAFAGAGRALPSSSPEAWITPAAAGDGIVREAVPVTAGESAVTGGAAAAPGGNRDAGLPAAPKAPGMWEKALRGKGFTVGFAFAPTWSGFMERNNPVRGIAAQGRFGWKGAVFGQILAPGFEIRPEWDDALGVFRIAYTFSLGFDDKVRFFAGPATSMGTPAMKLQTGERLYTGGNSWFGAAGVTLAPLNFPVGKGSLDLYGELAWQSYYRVPGSPSDWNSDMSAGLRFSTGLRYTWDL